MAQIARKGCIGRQTQAQGRAAQAAFFVRENAKKPKYTNDWKINVSNL
jgi:hypothetical protein